ncbi:hypothetical protein ACJRO7_008152 [Eucalyptus globulus]|uniref:Aldose 1-epimerase n=1 Tax=Eucalyptus globulus TaxID=34317 RepID=A0ABD3IQ95_EUCGL
MLSLILPDKHGELGDKFDKYKNDSTYFGATVEQVANRIGRDHFTLNGTCYKLFTNEGNNTLIWQCVIWTMKSYREESCFPGDLSVSVTYIIIETNKLGVKLEAKALNKATPVNLALHTYWNLGGHNNGDILSHTIQLFGSKINRVDEHLIPASGIMYIVESPYDFLQRHQIGSRINELSHGYDINYVLDNMGHRHRKKVMIVGDSITGRKMELWSNQPGMQFYTANYLENKGGKGGFVYSSHAGLCSETRGFPECESPKFSFTDH